MTPLQRNGMHALRAPVLPGFLLWIDVDGDVTVSRFVYRESYMPGGGIHKRDDPVWVVRVTEKNEFSQPPEGGGLCLFVLVFEFPFCGRFADDVA